MNRQHEVNIVINKGNGIREPVLSSRKTRLREWFIKSCTRMTEPMQVSAAMVPSGSVREESS